MRHHTSRWIFLFALALPLLGGAEVRAAPLSGAPLDDAASKAVLKEIGAMVKTPSNKVHQFVVREATPERIARLYNSPQLIEQSKIMRENGLIFAGHGRLLGFTKPSDVLARMEAWFPDAFADVHAMKEPGFFTQLSIFGPYADWEAEPAAFIALWKCMPQSAWIRPNANPFMRRLGQGQMFQPMANNGSAAQEYDFGNCIRERVGYQTPWTDAEVPRSLARARQVADKVTPVLAQKFAHLLATNRCRGTGADDCVLAMRQWVSLAPADTGVARAMQSLEPELGLDQAAPAPPPDTGKRDADGLPQFDEGLRQAAYLRAKLQSVLGAPSAWPPQALATTLRQMTALRIAAIPAIRHQDVLYELDYRNEALNPWDIVAQQIDKSPALHDAVLAELERLGPPPIEAGPVFTEWINHAGARVPSEYALLHQADMLRSRGVGSDLEHAADTTPTPARIVSVAETPLTTPEPQSCNKTLVSAVLAARLRINVSEGGDLIDLACKPHPLRAGRTIVAVFHELRDNKGNVDEDAKGFAMAVIDIAGNKVLQLYRDKVALDPSVRIGIGRLQLDTGRYNLAPGVRALGVRMNIGNSHRCAEAGESEYLTLLVEEGAKLRPVLKDLAMSSWRITQGEPCSDSETPTVTDTVKNSIVVLPGMTNAWHDLQVVAQHSLDTYSGKDGDNAKPVVRTEKGVILHAVGKQYPTH